MPSLSFQFNPSVGPLIQLAIWTPNYRLTPAPATPIAPTLYTALIDTGASCTCISNKVVQDVSLNPTGKAPVSHAHGATAVNTYQFQVAFLFPQNISPSGIAQTQVMTLLVNGTEFTPPAGAAFDVLLGRDVLCRGVFTISFDGHGTFSI
jgi:Aspartyl protease